MRAILAQSMVAVLQGKMSAADARTIGALAHEFFQGEKRGAGGQPGPMPQTSEEVEEEIARLEAEVGP